MAILLGWWPAACQAQHWNPQDRDLRLQTVSRAVGRPVSSMSELDNSRDIDQVKAYLKYLTDDLSGTIEVGNPEPGERRRLLWLIRRHSGTLALPGAAAESYALALARDEFHLTAGLATLEDLPTSDLHQLMMTLCARLSATGLAAALKPRKPFRNPPVKPAINRALMPLPPERFYRAWQTGTPSVMPSLALHVVPAITLTGSLGHSVRLDYINRFGPIGAWVTLDTVALTNTSQLYFDTSSIGQPQRLYRLVPVP